MWWDDVNARARGLATHLLSPSALEDLAGAADLAGLVDRMEAAGLPLETESIAAASPLALDGAIGRLTAERLALLGRWLGPGRRRALAVIYERLDLENLRRLVRGLSQGASAGARLRGTVPTPDLPERALRGLSQASTMADLAARLRRLGHPAARLLTEPSLLGIELALARLCAVRSSRLSRRGGTLLREYVAESIDLWNAEALLEQEHWGDALTVEGVWLPGGSLLPEPEFRALAEVSDAVGRRARLAQLLQASLPGPLLADPTVEPSDLETRALGGWIQRLRATARRQPLGVAPTLLTLLRIQAEGRDLRSLLWGVVLDAPRSRLVSALLAA